MTFSSPAATGAAAAPRALALLAHGPADQVRALLAEAGPPLAAALALAWCGLPAPADPDALLAAPPAGLVPLPLDPGQSLETGGTWAEALGAWRQPALVVVSAAQAGWGLPAASTALLQGHGVPLLGLVQWGGPWQPRQRRREGLPWLGWLSDQAGPGSPPADREAAALRLALGLALADRCRGGSG